jgi:hypothetical protein
MAATDIDLHQAHYEKRDFRPSADITPIVPAVFTAFVASRRRICFPKSPQWHKDFVTGL